MKNNQTEFWDFCWQIYRQPGVEDDCLYLQDHHQCDVMLALFLIWSGATNLQLESAQVTTLVESSQALQNRVIGPLRQVRRYLKTAQLTADAELRSQQEQLRTHIKKLELESEKLQAQVLQSQAPQPGIAENAGVAERKNSCDANIAEYLRGTDIDPDHQAQETFQRLINLALDMTR